jgi:acetyl-CoA C-acetyltransferase
MALANYREDHESEVAIVSTAPPPIGKAYGGAFNNTHGPELGGHALRHAVARAGTGAGEVEDVIVAADCRRGATGDGIARQIALPAGLPVSNGGQTVNRFCASGCRRSPWRRLRPLVRHRGSRDRRARIHQLGPERTQERLPRPERLAAHKPAVYMAMIDTAEGGRVLRHLPRRAGRLRPVQPTMPRRSQGHRALRRRDRALTPPSWGPTRKPARSARKRPI